MVPNLFFAEAKRFSEALAAVREEGWGYSFSNGLALVNTGNSMEYLNKAGKSVWQFKE